MGILPEYIQKSRLYNEDSFEKFVTALQTTGLRAVQENGIYKHDVSEKHGTVIKDDIITNITPDVGRQNKNYF